MKKKLIYAIVLTVSMTTLAACNSKSHRDRDRDRDEVEAVDDSNEAIDIEEVGESTIPDVYEEESYDISDAEDDDDM